MNPEINKQTPRQAFMLWLLDPERAIWRTEMLRGAEVAPPQNPNLQPHFRHDAVAIANATPEQREAYTQMLETANLTLHARTLVDEKSTTISSLDM